MSERMVERDERGREIVYVDHVPCTSEWNMHINNLGERKDGESDERDERYDESRNRTKRNYIHYSNQRMV